MSKSNPIRAAIKRLMAALDRAASAQREVEAARAALDRAAARCQLRVVGAEDKEGRSVLTNTLPLVNGEPRV